MKKFLFFVYLFNLKFLALTGETISNPPKQQESIDQDNQDIGIVSFNPPVGWGQAETSSQLSTVKVMVIGKGEHAYPPSMNLATQPYRGTLKDYLKLVKERNDAKGDEWKDLGMIKTNAGNASLSQVDSKTEWGETRQMHVILLKNGNIYILTASALKEEFPKFYKQFFTAMRSLKVSTDYNEMLQTTEQKKEIQNAIVNIQKEWDQLVAQKQQEIPTSSIETIKIQIFESDEFKNKAWKPFKTLINEKYGFMGPEWSQLVLDSTEDRLFEGK